MWLAAAIAVTVLGFTAIHQLRRRLFAVTVEGSSMEPTLVAGDRLIARRVAAAALRPGQLVIIEKPSLEGGWHWDNTLITRITDGHWMIKRIAAVPGDPVPSEIAATIPAIPAETGGRVPAGSILVLGDNRDASIDSRELGLIPVGRVLGVGLRRHTSHPAAGRAASW